LEKNLHTHPNIGPAAANPSRLVATALLNIMVCLNWCCVDDKDDETDNSCLNMLSIFSSKRHGEPDNKLPRSVRLVIIVINNVDLIKSCIVCVSGCGQVLSN